MGLALTFFAMTAHAVSAYVIINFKRPEVSGYHRKYAVLAWVLASLFVVLSIKVWGDYTVGNVVDMPYVIMAILMSVFVCSAKGDVAHMFRCRGGVITNEILKH